MSIANLYLYGLVLISSILSFYFRIYLKVDPSYHFFWDSMVYYCGPYYFWLKKDPYTLLNECSEKIKDFKYVYLPIYLEWFKFFLNISQGLFFQLWALLISISICLTTFFLKKTFLLKNYFFTLLVLLFAFSGIPLYGFLSGNISILLYALVSLGILLTTKKKKEYIFLGLILIFISSLFKVHMIIFYLVPLVFLGTKYFKFIALFTTFTISFIFYNSLIYPDLFQKFLKNLNVLPFAGDMGVGLFKMVNLFNSNILNLSEPYRAGVHNWDVSPIKNFDFTADYTISIFVILIFLTLCKFIRASRFSKSGDESTRIKIALSVLICYLCIPRLKQYDMFLNSIACFYLTNSQLLKEMILINSNRKIQIFAVGFLNFLLLGFTNIKGDNFLIYPYMTLFLVLFFTLFTISKKRKLLNI